MKKWLCILGGLAIATCAPAYAAEQKPTAGGAAAVATPSAAASPFKSEQDKISYSIGLNYGKSLKQAEIELNVDTLSQGIRDGVSGNKPLLSDAEIRDTLTALQREMMGKQMERMKVLSEKNKKEGAVFLAENKKKEGVQTTASGLQYKVLKEGAGQIPKATDTVTVNYRGALIDGTEFDSSYKRGEPVTFPVGGVIPGWTEALQLMKVGAKYQLYVPAELAYGENGAGPEIGPNATLVFDVELMGIEEAAPAK